jgi:uncharacterized OB-fold protein
MPEMTRPASLPVPERAPNVETEVHFDALAQGTLVISHCAACNVFIWYPRQFCPHCGTTEIEWRPVNCRGHVYSYAIVHKGVGPYAAHTPYVLAYVELDEGPRVMTNIVGPFASIAVGSPVEAVFEVGENGDPILRFELAAAVECE